MSRKKHLARKRCEARDARKIKPLETQVRNALREKCAFGTSKHEDAKNGVDTFQKIYSHSTYENYLKEGRLFVNWCRVQDPEIKTLEECKDYRLRYVQDQINRGMSPSTIKKRAAALGKLYGESILDKIETPERKRSEITRSRSTVENDYRFKNAKHDDFKEFCRSTGLRRHEFAQLVPEKLTERDGRLWLEDIKGKGGKVRDIPIYGNEELVKKLMKDPQKYFKKLDTHMDIHSYRAEYACRVYKAHARPLDDLERSEIYCCRGDMAGKHYDKQGMQHASWALGHNRLEVVASNYLYNLD